MTVPEAKMAYNFNEMSEEEIKILLSDQNKLSELSSEELISLKSFVKDDLSMQADLDKRINNLKTPARKDEPEESDEFVFSQTDMEAENKVLKEIENTPEDKETQETFDEENNLDTLTREQLAENQKTVDKFADFNPFELNENKELVHPEFADEYKAYKNLHITDDQGNEIADSEKAEKIKGLLVETARLETDLQAQTSPKFMTPEEYIAKLKNNLQKGIVVSAYASEMQNRSPDEISRREIAEKFNDVLGRLGEEPLKTSAKSIFAYVGVANDRMTKIKDRLKAKFKELPAVQKAEEKLRQFDTKAEKTIGPKSWKRIKRWSNVAGKRLKNIAVYGAVGYATGGVGLAILAAKSGYDMYTSMQKKAANENISLKEYARKNPWETTLSASQTALSAIGAAAGLGGFGEGTAQAVSPILKTAGRVLAVGPKLVKTAVKFGKLKLIESGRLKGDAAKTKQEFNEALDQTIDAAVGIFTGEVVHDATHNDAAPTPTENQTPPREETPPANNEAEQEKTPEKAEPEHAAQPESTTPQKETPEPVREEVLTAEQTFWDNRADKFLGEENTKLLYARIDSGEIKLPEGIETKQEFAYKLAMAFEQTPALVAEDLGDGFRNTAELEARIAGMTPEQFEKLGGLMNDFSDRGQYTGSRPLYQPQQTEKHDNGNNNEEDKTPQNSATEEKEPKEQQPEQPAEVRDEEYYRDMQGLKELKEAMNEARKDPNITVEQTLDAYLKLQMQNGQLTEQQARELGNYMKQELDLQNKENGDDDISKKDIRRAIKETEKTTEAMEQNAEEVLIAKNLTYPPREDLPEQLPESYSHDTESSGFYKGLSGFMKDVREQANDGVKPQDTMKAAILEGRISEEQATVVNTRWAELRAEGNTPDRTFRIMEKDFARHADYYQAQENARETPPPEQQRTEQASENTTGENRTLTSEIKHERESEQGQAPVMSQNELAKYLAEEVRNGTITEDEAKAFAKNYVEKHSAEMKASETADSKQTQPQTVTNTTPKANDRGGR